MRERAGMSEAAASSSRPAKEKKEEEKEEEEKEDEEQIVTSGGRRVDLTAQWISCPFHLRNITFLAFLVGSNTCLKYRVRTTTSTDTPLS